MFEILKAIWNLPEKLKRQDQDLTFYVEQRLGGTENKVENEFSLHKAWLSTQLQEFTKSLTEMREMVHPDHAKVENFSPRIATLEKAILELKDKVDRINDRYWLEQFSNEKEIDTQQKENPEVDSITLKDKPFEYFIQQLELSGHSNELLKAQRRYINRLLRLLRTTAEDPGKSITEDLRKAEKWNKVLKRRFKEWKEDYIGNK